MIEISISNSQSILRIDTTKIIQAVRALFESEGILSTDLSIAIVDDDVIHEMNRRFLDHDYATDVLSFPLHESDEHLEGEVVVSAEQAVARADEFHCTPADELLRYVIHGVLHLVGYRDKEPHEVSQMRAREDFYLAKFASAPETAQQQEARRREEWA